MCVCACVCVKREKDFCTHTFTLYIGCRYFGTVFEDLLYMEGKQRLNTYTHTHTQHADYRYFGYFEDGEDTEESERFKAWLYNAGTVKGYRRGEVMLPIGSTERCLFHVLSGTGLALSGSGATLAQVSAGEMFGKVYCVSLFRSLWCVIDRLFVKI